MCVCTCAVSRARSPDVVDGSIDMQDRDNRLPHSSRRNDVARFEYAGGSLSLCRSYTTHTKRECSAEIRLSIMFPLLCHCILRISLSSGSLSLSLSPSPPLSVTRPFTRVSDPAPTRSTVRSISEFPSRYVFLSLFFLPLHLLLLFFLDAHGRSRKLLFHLAWYANSSRATRYSRYAGEYRRDQIRTNSPTGSYRIDSVNPAPLPRVITIINYTSGF